ncbi:MAG: hypothetical protein SGJ18_10380 [Pseudomonadota bacterium]|nr:hypothetical protein [Pseudomonadota bacterium]
MKNLIITTAAAVLLMGPSAFSDHHEDGKKPGKKMEKMEKMKKMEHKGHMDCSKLETEAARKACDEKMKKGEHSGHTDPSAEKPADQ